MESKPAQPNILMRVAIIVAIIIILAIISFGIITVVPKALSSLASANLSFSSLFAPKTSTSTPVVISGATTTENTAPGTSMTWQSTSTPSTSYNTNAQPSTTYANTGTPDLAVTITGQNISNGTYANNNTATITFEVRNIGTRSTGAWSITTREPMINTADQTHYSGALSSLRPGASTGIITLTLSGLSPQGGVISIQANAVSGETNTANNIASLTVPANGNYSSGTYYTTTGNADLAVAVTNTIGSTVQFTVRNLGNVTSSPWTISVSYPGSSNGNLASQQEAGLAPGAVTSFNLTLTGIQNNNGYNYGYNSNSYPVTITIYPQGYDANTSNNTATTVVY